MTQEEKDLLLKELFARLPYGTFVQFEVDGCYHGHCSPLVSERVFDKEPSAYQSNKPNWDYPC